MQPTFPTSPKPASPAAGSPESIQPMGLVLFAHGSRDALWRAPVEAIAAEVQRRQPQTLVHCVYLEFGTLTLAQAATKLIAAGAALIRVMPVFIGYGKHVRVDLPLELDAVRVAHPGHVFELMPAAGEWPQVTSLLADIALQAPRTS